MSYLCDEVLSVLGMDKVHEAEANPHVPGVAEHGGEVGRGVDHQPRVHRHRHAEAVPLLAAELLCRLFITLRVVCGTCFIFFNVWFFNH